MGATDHSPLTPLPLTPHLSPIIRLLDFQPNCGKAATLNAAWPELTGDIVLLSDANTFTDERMKMGGEHLIPLPSQAVALLRGLKFLTGKYPHLFPHRERQVIVCTVLVPLAAHCHPLARVLARGQ